MSFTIKDHITPFHPMRVRFIRIALENAVSLQGCRLHSFQYTATETHHIMLYNVSPFDDFSIGSKVELGISDNDDFVWLNQAISHKYNKAQFRKL